MAKYKPQHARLLFIDRKIKEGRFPNCSTLAVEWEVSSKTIQRDLDYMRYQLDAPIEYSAKDRGYRYTEPQYQLPAMDIKERDLFAVYLAEKLLIQYEGTPIYDSLCSVFKKIEDALPSKVHLTPDTAQERFTVFPPHRTTINPEVLETMMDCLRSSLRVAVVYQTPGQEPIHRQLDPYHGVRYEGDWYVVGYCHLRGAIRTFSLSRVVSAKALPTTFTIAEEFDFQQLSGNRFGVHWGDEHIKVKIVFSRHAAPYVRERMWHPSQKLENRKDGSLILSLTVSHMFELQRWILSWGEQAIVLEPQSLADKICSSAQDMLASYNSAPAAP